MFEVFVFSFTFLFWEKPAKDVFLHTKIKKPEVHFIIKNIFYRK